MFYLDVRGGVYTWARPRGEGVGGVGGCGWKKKGGVLRERGECKGAGFGAPGVRFLGFIFF